jgi:VIT1/CCC1 family predicted Fe2+/Mn2+ transporter
MTDDIERREDHPLRGRLHPNEPHAVGLAGRLNWLRAGVLGANDGIVSVAGLDLFGTAVG